MPERSHNLSAYATFSFHDSRRAITAEMRATDWRSITSARSSAPPPDMEAVVLGPVKEARA